MDLNAIAQLIGSLGFPIFISVYLIYFIQTSQKETTEALHSLNLTMQKLIDKLDKEAEKDEK